MKLNSYQKTALESAVYPDRGNNLTYPILGLAGEAGEVAEKYKKILRDGTAYQGDFENDMRNELGDVLWYIAAVADELGLSLEDIASNNLKKTANRRERGNLGGNGDYR